MYTKSSRGSFIRIGDIVNGRYRIRKQIGAGGCGIVYSCYDLRELQHVAMKFDRSAMQSLVRWERDVMLAASSCSHIVNALDFGTWNGRNYLVMDHLGPDLSRDVANQIGNIYSPIKIAYFGRQMIEAIMQLHGIGYFHNDLKPSNFALGNPPFGSTDTLYLFDFGLARTAEQSFERSDNIVGTLIYASIGAHLHYVSDPWNDLQSVFYSLISLATGSLPWMDCSNAEEVFQRKVNLKIQDVVSEQYESILKMGSYLGSSNFVGTPNYRVLIRYFDDEVRRLTSQGLRSPLAHGKMSA
ncbi:Pkinase domain containing protein [Trichuris trichiura]|uniref:Pkinase domain containing protein n=1 Tax=Trichuris trichiura TaxID=36087 RepID=A0A077ZMG9_TRITR|nr:Pkinase domain containing protein [Trichuris trichiura]